MYYLVRYHASYFSYYYGNSFKRILTAGFKFESEEPTKVISRFLSDFNLESIDQLRGLIDCPTKKYFVHSIYWNDYKDYIENCVNKVKCFPEFQEMIFYKSDLNTQKILKHAFILTHCFTDDRGYGIYDPDANAEFSDISLNRIVMLFDPVNFYNYPYYD
ncbi:MAG: hypothetical protein NUV92_10520 [Ignavibacteria bacterium]|jgi:hypothetical protein|nr:hypothetical protein [Ignavibacteria bacterium]MDH7527238.1 hypothetical protein [Ignavibacteria bacterium]